MHKDSQWLRILTTAIDQAYNAVLITDADREQGGPRIVYVNPAFCRMTGYDAGELLGQSPRILQGEKTDPAVIDRLRDCLREGRYFSGSTFNYRKDGAPYIVAWSVSPIRADDGVITHFVSLQQDITDRVQAEEDLRRLTEALRRSRDDVVAILNTFPTATLILETDGTLGFCSASASALLDLDPETSLGQDWRALLPVEAEGIAALQTSLNCPETERAPLTLACQAGPREFWLECRVTDDPRDAGRRLVFLDDVTELHRLRQQLDASHFNGLIGDSEPMRTLHQQIQAVARGNWTVLIEGETGVGKELVARAIHAASPRRNGPFIAVNSAGLSESLMTSQLFGHRKGAFTGAVADQKGFFEEAAGGTLFLDEIGDMPPAIQAALLRVLQENEITRVGETWTRPIDVRVIGATHRNLLTEAAAGRFREDLLYRFRVARIHVPPLRQRKTDIPQLAAHFLHLAASMAGHSLTRIAPAALRCLMAHDWPGNVRELRAAIDFAAIYGRGPQMEAGDLPPELRATVVTPSPATPSGSTAAEPEEDDEASRIRVALKRCRDNRSEAARLLGMSRSTFYRRLRELGLEG